MSTQQHYSQLHKKHSILALWYITNTSLISYYKLIEACGDAKSALVADESLWRSLAIHNSHLKRWQEAANVMAFIEKVEREQEKGLYGLLFLGDVHYPEALTKIYDPPPVLFYRGCCERLLDKQIAIVGSRNPTEHAQKITYDLAQYLVQCGYTITSGLAQGVDKQAHLGALAQLPALSGRTVGVMGTGIDVCYPRNHNALFAQIISDGGCLLTELLPSTPASKHTFPRRNRLVAGLSSATVVTEAALQSGSLITARLCAEQGKQVFAVPSLIDNPQAEGCHHLIREGATLIYHPDQILEDLQTQGADFYNALPKSFSQGVSAFSEMQDKTSSAQSQIQTTQPNSPKPSLKKSAKLALDTQQATEATRKLVPKHLSGVYDLIEGAPKDLDVLVERSGLVIGELLALLMELELLGLIKQLGGRYVRS